MKDNRGRNKEANKMAEGMPFGISQVRLKRAASGRSFLFVRCLLKNEQSLPISHGQVWKIALIEMATFP
jgi:hypothetical protein